MAYIYVFQTFLQTHSRWVVSTTDLPWFESWSQVQSACTLEFSLCPCGFSSGTLVSPLFHSHSGFTVVYKVSKIMDFQFYVTSFFWKLLVYPFQSRRCYSKHILLSLITLLSIYRLVVPNISLCSWLILVKMSILPSALLSFSVYFCHIWADICLLHCLSVLAGCLLLTVRLLVNKALFYYQIYQTAPRTVHTCYLKYLL